MKHQLLIAGGGIAGLASALAGAHARWRVRLFEQAKYWAELGAGIQLSPNSVRCLHAWNLYGALQQVAALPQKLCVRSAITTRTLAQMPLGRDMVQRYGACYATIHRADLQQILLQAVRQCGAIELHLQHNATHLAQEAGAVVLHTRQGQPVPGDALLIADGVHSQLRQQLLGDDPARFSGYWAWRALLHQNQLPRHLRTHDVTLWLGPGLHAVQYPVRQGEMQNLVIVTEGRGLPGTETGMDNSAKNAAHAWNRQAPVQHLLHALRGSCGPLQEVTGHVCATESGWRLWPVNMRPPLRGPAEMARQRIALAGDAAHPMPPYLAQGAGMALEDALALQQALALHTPDTAQRLRYYAHVRWRRNARVQAQALRNGRIFHAEAPLRWARDAAMRLLGRHLLDQNWLYRAHLAQ